LSLLKKERSPDATLAGLPGSALLTVTVSGRITAASPAALSAPLPETAGINKLSLSTNPATVLAAEALAGTLACMRTAEVSTLPLVTAAAPVLTGASRETLPDTPVLFVLSTDVVDLLLLTGAGLTDLPEFSSFDLLPNQFAGENLVTLPINDEILSLAVSARAGVPAAAGVVARATPRTGKSGTAALPASTLVDEYRLSAEVTAVTCAPGKRVSIFFNAASASSLLPKKPRRSCCHCFPSLLKLVV